MTGNVIRQWIAGSFAQSLNRNADLCRPKRKNQYFFIEPYLKSIRDFLMNSQRRVTKACVAMPPLPVPHLCYSLVTAQYIYVCH